MADQPKASGIPSRTTFEDFDVLTGKADASKDEYFKSTFHTSSMNGDDPIFKAKATLLESSASEIEADGDEVETDADSEAQARTKKQATEAAL